MQPADPDFFKFPDPKTLGRALGLWRMHKKLSVEKVQAGLADRGIKREAKTIVSTWECGKIEGDKHDLKRSKASGIDIKYSTLVEKVFPAYRVDDILAFLSICRMIEEGGKPPEERKPLIKHVGTFKPFTEQNEKVRSARCSRKDLGDFPFRLDYVELDPGGVSGWHVEPALEFVYVIKGKVTILHADAKDTPADQCERVDLNQYQAASVNSNRPHHVINRAKTISLVAVAKSPRSRQANCDTK